MTPDKMTQHINDGGLDDSLTRLYPPETLSVQRARLCGAVAAFEKDFGGGRELRLFSAPGRTEIGGNHTDHQHGRVLAAAVDLDVLCACSPNDSDLIRICSEGYPPYEVELTSLVRREEEKNTSCALVRGIASSLRAKGFAVRGFDAYITSSVLKGSGLSSSAAFEVAVGAMINGMFNDGAIPPVELAKTGQYAENKYFGKPCGLMDQMASAVGGCVAIDFSDPENPLIEKVDFDFSKSGYTLCIIDTKGSHANLTGEYAAIPGEMHAAARVMGKTHLRNVEKSDFFSHLAEIREACGDRAALRAIHFFGDNERVARQVLALQKGDFLQFLGLINESGRSSSMYLQNIYACGNPREQSISIALALSDALLTERKGAFRVHGGGFAGTIQAFVPTDFFKEYSQAMEAVFGIGSCHRLSIRPVGTINIM